MAGKCSNSLYRFIAGGFIRKPWWHWRGIQILCEAATLQAFLSRRHSTVFKLRNRICWSKPLFLGVSRRDVVSLQRERWRERQINSQQSATCTVSHTLPWNWDLYCLWRDTILVKWMFPSKELQLPSCESFSWRIHAANFLGHPKHLNMSLISFCACCSGTFLVVAAG